MSTMLGIFIILNNIAQFLLEWKCLHYNFGPKLFWLPPNLFWQPQHSFNPQIKANDGLPINREKRHNWRRLKWDQQVWQTSPEGVVNVCELRNWSIYRHRLIFSRQHHCLVLCLRCLLAWAEERDANQKSQFMHVWREVFCEYVYIICHFCCFRIPCWHCF